MLELNKTRQIKEVTIPVKGIQLCPLLKTVRKEVLRTNMFVEQCEVLEDYPGYIRQGYEVRAPVWLRGGWTISKAEITQSSKLQDYLRFQFQRWFAFVCV
jgi:hypothetical protein